MEFRAVALKSVANRVLRVPFDQFRWFFLHADWPGQDFKFLRISIENERFEYADRLSCGEISNSSPNRSGPIRCLYFVETSN